MRVSDAYVAPLRAQLSGDSEEHGRLLDELDKETGSVIYPTLVGAAFFKAAFRRFAKDGTVEDVVAFVADVRAHSQDVAEALDPKRGERIIMAALGQDDLADVDGNTQFAAQLLLLTALVADAQLNDEQLDAFLADTRQLADEWLANQ